MDSFVRSASDSRLKIMFNRDPHKKLRKAIEAKFKQAMEAQRKGDINLCAKLTAEADEMSAELEKAEGKK